MAASLVRWLESYSFGTQLLILTLVFDPLGAVLGYLAHPYLGVEPLIGVVVGLFMAGNVHVAWILRRSLNQD